VRRILSNIEQAGGGWLELRGIARRVRWKKIYVIGMDQNGYNPCT
jgi:hypothetical protein